MDRGFQVRPESRVAIVSPPSSYLRRLSYDCVVHSYPALDYLLETVGADNVLLGSDYPFDLGYDAPVRWLREAPGLSQEDREKVLGGNAARLLRL